MDSEIFCTGPLLHAMQMSGIFTDSKTYVDRPLLVTPQEALEEFAKLGTWPNINQKDVREFVDKYYAAAGSDLDVVIPPDYKTVDDGGLPGLIAEIEDDDLKKFAKRVHDKWKELGRKVSPRLGVRLILTICGIGGMSVDPLIDLDLGLCVWSIAKCLQWHLSLCL